MINTSAAAISRTRINCHRLRWYTKYYSLCDSNGIMSKKFQHQLSTDFDNNAGVNQSIHLFRQYSDYPVFYYQYSHRGSFSFAQLMGAPADFDQGRHGQVGNFSYVKR